jgi:hypothetical protein
MPDLLNATGPQKNEPRAATRVPILVRVECKTPRTYVQGQGENISQTGMLITSRETFDVSQAVTLRFALPVAPGKNVAVSTSAVVARAEEGRLMGLRFIGMRGAFLQAINEYIDNSRTIPARAV